jgi:hypothetical protein
MTDTEKLRKRIAASGLKHAFIAKCMGIGTAALTNKIMNRSDFKSREINDLCDLLGIDDLQEKDAIFFAK